METRLLADIVVIFAVAVAVLLLCHRLRLPTLIGFLLTGTLAGPHGLGLVEAVHEVELLAEVGIVLLLFVIGIEFSLKDLLRIKRQVLAGGFLQVGLTILAAFALGHYLGLAIGPAIFGGFLICLSSTAIVLRLLQEKAEMDSPHGRLVLAVLIFQDIAVVPMMLFAPLLAGAAGDPLRALMVLAAKGAGIIVLVLVAAEWLVPRLLLLVTRTRSRELFLLSIAAMCFAIAWLTAGVGLSLALGAFLAGLIISESEYSHQALGNILPLRDIFTSFFFVSVGMLLDVRLLVEQPTLILLSTLVVFLLKSLVASLVGLALGYPLRTALVAGLGLAQVGEFSFVLSRAGLGYGLLDGHLYPLFLAVSLLTMLATPLAMSLAPGLADRICALPWPQVLKRGLFAASLGMEQHPNRLEDHLIIAGFGVNGHNVARAARAARIPYVVIEMNPETVRQEKAAGESIYYGDASQEEVLRHAGIERARVLVAAIPDPAAVRCAVAEARRLHPGLYIVARTRFVQEMPPLYELGADAVIPEEFETSVAIFARVLFKYLVPLGEIEKFAAEIRADGYGLFRQAGGSFRGLGELSRHLRGIEIATLRIEEGAELAGRTLAQLNLRREHGVAVVAAWRQGELISNPDGDFQIHPGDELVVLAAPDKLLALAARCRV
jgi:CPA2 family monovalent cation:H+ antiporter-2